MILRGKMDGGGIPGTADPMVARDIYSLNIGEEKHYMMDSPGDRSTVSDGVAFPIQIWAGSTNQMFSGVQKRGGRQPKVKGTLLVEYIPNQAEHS